MGNQHNVIYDKGLVVLPFKEHWKGLVSRKVPYEVVSCDHQPSGINNIMLIAHWFPLYIGCENVFTDGKKCETDASSFDRSSEADKVGI